MDAAFQVQAAMQMECLQALRLGLETAIQEEVRRSMGELRVELSRRIDEGRKRLEILAQVIAAIAPKIGPTMVFDGTDYTPLHLDTPRPPMCETR